MQETINLIPALSKKYINLFENIGLGEKLFNEIDLFQHAEEISPQLAEAMRKVLTAAEQTTPFTLESYAIKGGVRYFITNHEGMISSAARAMEKHGEGNSGEIIVEWMTFVHKMLD